jgi:acyl carrier protein
LTEKGRIRELIRHWILTKYLRGESPSNLHDDTPLLRSGILNSLSTLDLVSSVENEFRFEVEPHEVNEINFGSIKSLVEFISRRISSGASVLVAPA